MQRCHKLVNGRDLWGNFRGKRSSLVFHVSCILFIYTDVLEKTSTWKLLHAKYCGKIAERKSLSKEKEKNRPKKKEITQFCQKRKRALPKATKALGLAKHLHQSWHLLKIQEQAKILGASTLKIKVNASACCDQDSSLESGGSDEEKGRMRY